MENVFLNGAQLQGANLHNVLLAKSQLVECQLECADLSFADLQEANLMQGQFKQAHLKGARLQEASLYKAQLEETTLYEAKLNGANLGDVKLSTQNQMGPLLADAQWTEVNLARVDWSQGKILGDEQLARQRKINGTSKTKVQRLSEYESAVRANRQLTVALQAQGLNEYASHFAYRAQVLQRRAFWFQMLQSEAKLRQRGRALGAWLFSWFLFLLAGYGYKPGRSFLAYLLVIGTFMALYLLLDPHLSWYEAIVVSMTAFHGRGFSPSTFSPGDPLSIASAVEALVGLIIEVTFIATLTQRFFSR